MYQEGEEEANANLKNQHGLWKSKHVDDSLTDNATKDQGEISGEGKKEGYF